MKNKELLLNT